MLLKYSSAIQLTFANAQLLEQDCPPFPPTSPKWHGSDAFAECQRYGVLGLPESTTSPFDITQMTSRHSQNITDTTLATSDDTLQTSLGHSSQAICGTNYLRERRTGWDNPKHLWKSALKDPQDKKIMLRIDTFFRFCIFKQRSKEILWMKLCELACPKQSDMQSKFAINLSRYQGIRYWEREYESLRVPNSKIWKQNLQSVYQQRPLCPCQSCPQS